MRAIAAYTPITCLGRQLRARLPPPDRLNPDGATVVRYRLTLDRTPHNRCVTDWVPTRYVSPEELTANQTPKGGFTRTVLAGWGVPWPPPKGWKRAVSEQDQWSEDLTTFLG